MSNIFGIEGKKLAARLTPHDMTLCFTELHILENTLRLEVQELAKKGLKTAAEAREHYRDAVWERIYSL